MITVVYVHGKNRHLKTYQKFYSLEKTTQNNWRMKNKHKKINQNKIDF